MRENLDHCENFLQPPMCATTGGLVDTVKEGITGFHMRPFNVDVRTCFLCESSYQCVNMILPSMKFRFFQCDVVDKDDIQKVVKMTKRVLEVYQTPAFAKMIQNCMDQDLSWKVSNKRLIFSPRVLYIAYSC